MHAQWGTRTRILATTLALFLLLASLDASAGSKRRARKRANLDYALPGTVEVMSTTHGALVEIDGRFIGNVPLEDELAVEPGQHTIRVHLRGWTEHTDSFVVKAGEAVELEIDLLPIAGIVRITTAVDGATVKINDRVLGVTPFDQDIPVGETAVMITHPGFQDHLQTLDLQAGQSYDLNIDLVAITSVAATLSDSENSIVRSWWFWTAVGGVAAIGIAAILVTNNAEPQEAGLLPGAEVITIGPQ